MRAILELENENELQESNDVIEKAKNIFGANLKIKLVRKNYIRELMDNPLKIADFQPFKRDDIYAR